MDLAKLIVKSKTIDFEYPGFPELFFSVAYLTRDELMDLRKKCTSQKFNKKTRQPEEEVDNELFQELYIKKVLKGWNGLKYKHLLKMIPMDASSVPEDEYMSGEGEFPYSPEAAEILMKNCSDLDNWVTDMLSDVENFTKAS